jgi:hypothetical protein
MAKVLENRWRRVYCTGPDSTSRPAPARRQAPPGARRWLTIVAGIARGARPEIQDAATRALGNWMSVDAAPVLLDLAKTLRDAKLKTRALRG